MKLSVASASGVEAVTKRELKKFGIENAPAINGRIKFEGDIETVALLNLNLSTASRVFIELAEFKCADFDTLFDGVTNIAWEDIISKNGKIIVEAKLVMSKLHAVSATQSIVKKAICERLKKAYKTSTLLENAERYVIEVSILKDFATISLNTSGEGLHRRGYRRLVGNAQLKENVASAMIDLSVWNRERPFSDLFCGTGTIAIEVALKAKGVPAGAFRDFDFLHFKGVDKSYFENAKSVAISSLNDKIPYKIHASDIDENQLKLAKMHAKCAGVSDMIDFKLMDMKDFLSPLKRGVVISNPPYGERLSERRDIERLYRTLGRVALNNDDWCFYTLTPVTDFEQLFGKRADKKRKLYNGKIECFYYTHLAKLKN